MGKLRDVVWELEVGRASLEDTERLLAEMAPLRHYVSRFSLEKAKGADSWSAMAADENSSTSVADTDEELNVMIHDMAPAIRTRLRMAALGRP